MKTLAIHTNRHRRASAHGRSRVRGRELVRRDALRKTQVAGDTTLTTSYTYNAADRLASITYPSGAMVAYARDYAGRITSVTYRTDANAAAQTILSNVSYYPFGPAHGFTFGNGRTLTKSYDQNYAIDSVASSDPNGLAIDASVDALGNLTAASSTPNANPPTRSYQYDPLYRLTGATDASNAELEGYSYNATGDRLSKTLQGETETYTYTSPLINHRVQNIAGVGRDYDPNGNTTQNNGNAYVYDERNRLTQAGGWRYDYNGRGERVMKRLPEPWSEPDLVVGSAFGYSPTGQLESEYSQKTQCLGPSTPSGCRTGARWWPDKEYIWADGVLVAVSVVGDSVYYVETDQLGTPRRVILPGETTTDDTVVWSWDYFGSTFGEDAPNQDPGDSGDSFTFNLRFPGQYYDAETGMHYNYFRDYEPGTGRYAESDPIGLGGGVSTYGYVQQNPTRYIDPRGLAKWSGNIWSATLATVIGGSFNWVSLDSECKCGHSYHIEILAVGPAGGLGYDFGGTMSTLKFDDFEECPDPDSFNGAFTFGNAGFTVGPNLPFTSIGAGRPGVGASVGWIQLGRNFSTSSPPGGSATLGRELGATGGFGTSTVVSISPNSQCCSK